MSYKIARHRRLDILGVPPAKRKRRRDQLEYLPQDVDAGLRLYRDEFTQDEQIEWERVESDRRSSWSLHTRPGLSNRDQRE